MVGCCSGWWGCCSRWWGCCSGWWDAVVGGGDAVVGGGDAVVGGGGGGGGGAVVGGGGAVVGGGDAVVGGGGAVVGGGGAVVGGGDAVVGGGFCRDDISACKLSIRRNILTSGCLGIDILPSPHMQMLGQKGRCFSKSHSLNSSKTSSSGLTATLAWLWGEKGRRGEGGEENHQTILPGKERL